MNQQIIDLIEAHAASDSFTYASPSSSLLEKVQADLDVTLPEQYVAFLNKYGDGGFNGFEIIGVGKSDAAFFEEDTQRYREYGLPNNLVMVENCDEWVYCIDCNDGSIVSWDFNGYQKKDYECFDDYLLDRISDAVENL